MGCAKPPTLRSLSATPVLAPMQRPLGTSAQTIDQAALLLLDLDTDEGFRGHAYAFCYLPSIARALVPVVDELSRMLAGQLLVPADLARLVARHVKLPGLAGPLTMAAASVDTACWDALAKSVGLPLSTLLGAQPHPIPAYNSNGLGLMPPAQAADEAEALVAEGFRAVKLRLGRQDFGQDLAAVRAVRRRLPEDVQVMVDFNQALSFAEAMQRCPRLDDEGLYWIEEPIRHDDYRHIASIARATRTPIQVGENFTGLEPMAAALEHDAADFLMLDIDRIGGVTGWQRAAGLAAAHRREISSHLFPEVSAHLLAATPTRHWLEYVDWAAPLLEEPLAIIDGMAIAPDRPGHGMSWNPEALERYRLT